MRRFRGLENHLFDIVIYLITIILSILVLYPLYFVVIAGISDPALVATGQVLLWPKDITFEGYVTIFNSNQIWTGYMNTIIYAVLGTAISVTVTITSGYALSRKDLVGRNAIMLIFAFTMLFSGGLVPTYLIVKSLGLINTVGAMIVPSALSVFYLIVTRTFFQTNIPDELMESAFMDGCTNFNFFLKIVLPLSKAVIAVMVLFYCVIQWNSYFSAMIYLNDSSKYPLQLVLTSILTRAEMLDSMDSGGVEFMDQQMQKAEVIKYGLVVVSCLPMLVLYPFLQKHFTKGVMVGSIKG